ncbi:MAG: signal peptidase I [Candidatus Sericytochromatia bacterium]|nr:signal peptidase I [Candidatus Tanganyikabacteria bacterium]
MNFFRKDRPKSKARETIETFAVAIGLALLVRATVAEARYIPSDSMLPTLEKGDRLIVEKISYHFSEPHRGDIVVFYPPKDSEFGKSGNAFIKRVVALPGERIGVSDGKVFVNGKAQSEPYELEPPDYEMPPREVPPGHVFVMGDNRNNSMDSHVWGFLPVKNIIGKATVRFWPPGRLGPPTP